jgi:hypothetical protein
VSFFNLSIYIFAGSKVYPWNCRGAVDYVIAKVTQSLDTLEVFSEAKRLELGKIANVQ